MCDISKALRAFTEEIGELVQPILDALPPDVKTKAIHDYWSMGVDQNVNPYDVKSSVNNLRLEFMWLEKICDAAISYTPSVSSELRVLTYIAVIRLIFKNQLGIDI